MRAEFREGDPKKRVLAILDAAEREDPPALVVELLDCFTDEHPFVRRAALDAIGRIAEFRGHAIDREVAQKIARMAQDADEGVRAETAIALAMIARGDARTETERLALHRLLEDPSPKVRRETAAALGDVADDSAKEKLAVSVENDTDPEVRFEAAFALAAMKDPRGLATLVDALDKPKKRLEACEGLRRLGSDRALPALQKLATRVFLAWPDRLTVLATMYALGDPNAKTGVLDRVRARNREERAYALSLIGSHRIFEGKDVLLAVAKDANDRLRDTAVRALGDLGGAAGPEVREMLRAIAEDTSLAEELRADAQRAIAKLG
jgi:HEAT repeat protein